MGDARAGDALDVGAGRRQPAGEGRVPARQGDGGPPVATAREPGDAHRGEGDAADEGGVDELGDHGTRVAAAVDEDLLQGPQIALVGLHEALVVGAGRRAGAQAVAVDGGGHEPAPGAGRVEPEVEQGVLAVHDVGREARPARGQEVCAVQLGPRRGRPRQGRRAGAPDGGAHELVGRVALPLGAGQEAHDVLPALQVGAHGVPPPGGQGVVGVDEHEAAPARGPDAGVAGRRDPPVVLAQVADAGVGQRAGPHDPAGRVGRAVVDDDDLDVVARARPARVRDRVQALAEIVRAVVGRDDDAQPRRHNSPPRRRRMTSPMARRCTSILSRNAAGRRGRSRSQWVRMSFSLSSSAGSSRRRAR